MAQHSSMTAMDAGIETSHIRKIGVDDLMEALSKGFEDFKTNPSHLIFLGIIYPILGLILVRSTAGYDLLPLVFPLITGFALVGPIAAIGLYEMSRQQEQGRAISMKNAFDVLKSPSLVSIIALSVLLLAIYLIWLTVAQMIYNMIIGDFMPASYLGFVEHIVTTSQGWSLIIIGSGIGFIFAIVVLSVAAVSFPMLVDRNVGVAKAVKTSIDAMAANPKPMMIWGLIITVALAFGSLPLFAGLAIVMPVLGHATWHLYRKVVVTSSF